MNLIRLGLVSLCLFAFQNCGEFKATEMGVPYPYTSQPDFFYDIKLVSLEVDNLGREAYEFDVVATFATNPNQGVNYRIAYATLDRSGICESQEWTAIGADKHERFRCLIPAPDNLYIQLTLVGPTGEQAVQQFRF